MTCTITDKPQESQARSVDELRQENTDLKREVKNRKHLYMCSCYGDVKEKKKICTLLSSIVAFSLKAIKSFIVVIRFLVILLPHFSFLC